MESENATIQQEPAAAGTVSLPAEDFGRKTLDEAETFADTILKRIRVKDAEGIKSDLTSLLSGAELLTSGKKDDRGLAGKIQSIIFVLLPTWREVMQTEIELREDGGPHELNIDGKKPETYHEEALKEAYRKLIAGLGEAITLGSEAARLRELADIGLQQLKREIGYLVPKAAATAAPEVRQSPLPPAE